MLLLAVAAANCGARREANKIETIEIHHSGWVGYNIIVHSNGTGEFEGSPSLPEKGKRNFTLSAGEFEKLAATLRPYLPSARPVTKESFHEIIEGTWPKCQSGQIDIIDAGALYVRWQGPDKNVHYLVNFGCKEQRASERQLMEAVHQLPVKKFLGDVG